MTATHLLLFGLIVFCVLGLFAVYIGHMINAEWRQHDERMHHTGDDSVLSAEAIELLRNANANRSLGCTDDCNQGRSCTCRRKPKLSTATPPKPNDQTN